MTPERIILSKETATALCDHWWAEHGHLRRQLGYGGRPPVLDYYQNLGWDLQYNLNLRVFAIPEHQAALFLLRYGTS